MPLRTDARVTSQAVLKPSDENETRSFTRVSRVPVATAISKSGNGASEKAARMGRSFGYFDARNPSEERELIGRERAMPASRPQGAVRPYRVRGGSWRI
jgi:hypothetical protein